MSVLKAISSSDRPYKVRLIATFNPHVFWLEPILEPSDDKIEYHLIQAGLANVFPADIKLTEPLCQFQRHSSRHWIPAAGRLLQKIVSEADESYFLPLNVLPDKFSLINNVVCIFGDLFVSKNGDLQSVIKPLSEYGFLYKSSTRFNKYLQSDYDFIDLEDEQLNKVVDNVLVYANSKYSSVKEEPDRGNSNDIRKLVTYYSSELNESLINNNHDQRDKIMNDMKKVYDMCIKVEENMDDSVRILSPTIDPDTIKKKQQSSSNAPAVTNSKPRNVCFLPAGAQITNHHTPSIKASSPVGQNKQSESAKRVKSYLEELNLANNDNSKENLKPNLSDNLLNKNTSNDNNFNQVSPNIMSFIKSVPLDFIEKEKCYDKLSMHDCSDVESVILSEYKFNDSSSTCTVESESDGTLVIDKPKKYSDNSSASSTVSTKLKFLKNVLKSEDQKNPNNTIYNQNYVDSECYKSENMFLRKKLEKVDANRSDSDSSTSVASMSMKIKKGFHKITLNPTDSKLLHNQDAILENTNYDRLMVAETSINNESSKTHKNKDDDSSVVSAISTSQCAKLKFFRKTLTNNFGSSNCQIEKTTNETLSSSSSSSTSSDAILILNTSLKNKLNQKKTIKESQCEHFTPSKSCSQKLKFFSGTLNPKNPEEEDVNLPLANLALKSKLAKLKNDTSESSSVVSSISTAQSSKLKFFKRSLLDSKFEQRNDIIQSKKCDMDTLEKPRNDDIDDGNIVSDSLKMKQKFFKLKQIDDCSYDNIDKVVNLVPKNQPNDDCDNSSKPVIACSKLKYFSLNNNNATAWEKCDVAIESTANSLNELSKEADSENIQNEVTTIVPTIVYSDKLSIESINHRESSPLDKLFYEENNGSRSHNEVKLDPESDPDLVLDNLDESLNDSGSSNHWNVSNMLRFGIDTLGVNAPFSVQFSQTIANSSFYSETEEKSTELKHLEFHSTRNYFEGDLIENVLSPKIVIHNKSGESSIPVRDLESSHFLPVIIKNLESLGIKAPTKLQSSVWPMAFRDRSSFVIGPVNSGRGMSILVPVCNKLPKIVVNNLSEGVGPILMVVCSDICSASKIYTSCKILLKNCVTTMGYEFKIVKIDDWNDSNYSYTICKGADVLIITSQCLYKFLNYEVTVIDLSRLLYLVFEDLDILNEQYYDETKLIIDACQKANKGNENQQLHVYASSQIWCELLERLAKESYNPTVIISAVQECLFYANTQFNVALITQDNKLKRLQSIFNKADGNFKRIVIVCKTDEEIAEINNLLKETYIVCVAGCTTIDVLEEVRHSWNNHNLHSGSIVMITMDENLDFLGINNGHCLIHYSLPKTFARFNMRFATMTENFLNLYDPKPHRLPLEIELFVTENDLIRLPKLTQFISRFNINMPDEVQNILRKVIIQQDHNKANLSVPLCERLSAFGYCSNIWSCIERHAVDASDQPDEWLPRLGRVKCYVTFVHHASLFSARLLEHTDYKGKKHSITQKHILIYYALNAYFSSEGNRKCHGRVKCGDICAIKLDTEFKRCRVLRIIPSNLEFQSDIMRVNLLDEERYVDVKKHELLHLPDGLKAIHSRIVKVRLAGVTPSNDNNFWSTTATNNVQKLLSTDDDLFIQGNIVLGIGNTLWLDDIQICRTLESLNVDIVKCNLKRNLISNEYAVSNPSHLDVLYELCKSSNYPLPCYSKPKKNIASKKKLFEPQWAHLNENFNSVYFSYGDTLDSFFIRHEAFDDILVDLENDLQTHVDKMKEKFVSTDSEITPDSIQRGYYCVALFVDGGTYNRAKVLRIVESEGKSKLYECYFVDHGEKRNVRSEDTYPINEDLIKRLPFQAIECRIYGVRPVEESWKSYEIDKLYAFSFIGDTEDLKPLIAKYYIKEKAEWSYGHKYAIVLVDFMSQTTFTDFILSTNLVLPVAEEMDLISKDSDNIKNLYQVVDLEDEDHEYTNDSLSRELNVVDWTDEEVEQDDQWDCEFYKENYESLLKRDHLPRICNENIAEKNLGMNVSFKDQNVKKVIPFMSNKTLCRTPRVLWHQTDEHVTIKIMLADVHVYECTIESKTLYFETTVEGERYKLDIELAACILENKSYHVTKGMYVFIRLYKHKTISWETLTAPNSIVNNKLIVYDPDFAFVEDDPDSDSEGTHFKKIMEERLKNEDDQIDSDEEECEDVKALDRMELDPINRQILRQLKEQCGENSDQELDTYYDSE